MEAERHKKRDNRLTSMKNESSQKNERRRGTHRRDEEAACGRRIARLRKNQAQLAEERGSAHGRRGIAKEGEEEGEWRKKKRLVHNFYKKIHRGIFDFSH